MSYKFPRFNDIPHPDSVNFANIPAVVNSSYCSLVSEDNTSCEGCVFDVSPAICSAYSDIYKQERKDLLNYVKLNHPEYLL